MKILFALLIAAVVLETSFYTLNVTDSNNNTISLSQFRGKKVLLVNTASGSKFYKQMDGLQELYSKHKNDLVVIVFPSNSFGNEPMDSAAITSAMRAKGYEFIIANKSALTGENANPVYKWVADIGLNGRWTMPVNADFKKYLVDRDGKISNIFMPVLDPLDSIMIKAVIR